MCDASEHVPGYVLLIEEDKDEETGETNKIQAVVLGSKRFTIGQLSLVAKNVCQGVFCNAFSL